MPTTTLVCHSVVTPEETGLRYEYVKNWMASMECSYQQDLLQFDFDILDGPLGEALLYRDSDKVPIFVQVRDRVEYDSLDYLAEFGHKHARELMSPRYARLDLYKQLHAARVVALQIAPLILMEYIVTTALVKLVAIARLLDYLAGE